MKDKTALITPEEKIIRAGNPYFAPKDGRCLINELPSELLSHIFELGALGDDEGDADLYDFEDMPGEYEDEDIDEDGKDVDDLPIEKPGDEDEWETESEEDDDDDDDDDEDDEDEEPERGYPFELLVSRVCKRWREVALEVPMLWTNLEFKQPRNLDKHRAYLKRAKAAPLYISIDVSQGSFHEGDSDGEDEESGLHVDSDEEYMLRFAETPRYKKFKEILDLVIPHVEHWRAFELMVAHYVLMQLTLETLGNCPGAPLLEVLELYHYEDEDETEDFIPAQYKEQNFVLFHGNVPKLTHVSLWGVHLDWQRTHFLSDLYDFEMAYHALNVRPSYNDFLRILRSSPRLRTLTLCQSGPAGTKTDWLQSVVGTDESTSAVTTYGSPTSYTIPQLKELVLAFLPPTYIIDLLDRLSMPSLNSLALDFEDEDCLPLLERLTATAPGSSKTILSGIEKIKISGISHVEPAVVVKVYSTLANLQELNLNFNHIDRVWFDLLKDPASVDRSGLDSRAVLCPRLTTFASSDLCGEDLKELVEKRKAAGFPLKKVYANAEDDVEAREARWLRENLETFDYFEGSDDDDVIEIDDIEEIEDDADWLAQQLAGGMVI